MKLTKKCLSFHYFQIIVCLFIAFVAAGALGSRVTDAHTDRQRTTTHFLFILEDELNNIIYH